MLIIDALENHYLTSNHVKAVTAQKYRGHISKLNHPRQYAQWVAREQVPLRQEDTSRPPTRAERAQHYRQFNLWRGNTEPYWQASLADLNDNLIAAAMHFLVNHGLAIDTVNGLLTTVKCLARFAFDRKLENFSETIRQKKFRANRAEPVALMPDELASLFSACHHVPGMIGSVPAAHWWPAFLGLLHSTGLRVNAAMHIPTSHLDLERMEVAVPAEFQKHKREQRLDLLPGTVAALARLRLAERGVPTLFGDFPYGYHSLQRRYYRLYVLAGLFSSDAAVPAHSHGFHILRKTLASQIYAASGIYIACERLGHSNISVTMRYIDPRYRRDFKVAGTIPDPLTPVPRPPAPERPALKLFEA